MLKNYEMLKKCNFILASASVRRKEILSNAGYNFEIIPSNYEENIQNQVFSDEIINNCALQKALEVQKRINKNCLIVSCDTVVVLDNVILGKPKDENDAYRMLKGLSNKTHRVVSSLCLIFKDKRIVQNEVTKVTFRKLNDEEIINYIKIKRPFDKAGSYAIQDEGFDFATSIDGELNNVIGFPLGLFEKLIMKVW